MSQPKTKMGIELNDFLKEVLAAPWFGFIVAINKSNQPVMTRVFGFKYEDPLTTLTVYTFKKDAQRVVDLLSEDVKISISASKVANFKTAQFKGTYHNHYDVLEEEMHYVRDSNVKQTEIMASTGVPDGAFANWKYEPTVAIVINVDEIFDQTPKVNAGNKIS